MLITYGHIRKYLAGPAVKPLLYLSDVCLKIEPQYFAIFELVFHQNDFQLFITKR